MEDTISKINHKTGVNTRNGATTGALDNVRILDFSRLAPGPMATMILGDLGADVIKIEEPGGGKRARDERALKELPQDAYSADELRWRTFSPLERNKRSIMLDLRSDLGREVALKLVATCDVVVEGFRPGVMKRLGLDYEAVHAINRRAVYCSITGYGQSGGRSLQVGHDINYLAYAGALSLIGTSEGKPVVPGNMIADYAAGSLNAVIGIMAALLARDRTGVGQFVDVSMLDGVLSLIAVEVARYLSTGQVPRAGTTYLTGATAYYNIYETKDERAVAIACNEPKFFRSLCELLGVPELIEQQLTEPAGQLRNKRILQDEFRKKTLEEWTALFAGKEIPFAPVLAIDQVLTDPNLHERQMFVTLPSKEFDSVTQVASAVHLSDTPATVRHLPPRPGLNSIDILHELAYEDSEIARLISAGAVSD
jgi:crotonobetainyl-CoA:carnitine CoA-transferase CaiB-like acyl-CoA transferase